MMRNLNGVAVNRNKINTSKRRQSDIIDVIDE